MKLIKFVALCLCAPMAMALNFNGVGTLVGLNTAQVFTAPASGIYFLMGRLSLPGVGGQSGNQGAVAAPNGTSQVIATVSKNYISSTTASTLYVGVAGATGFSLPQMTLVSNDLITVGLSSTAIIDSASGAGVNAVRGSVYFGNAF